MSFYRRYVSVAERRAKAAREMARLRKKGRRIQPVEVEGRTVARSFWGRSWCTHLESFSDYANRLPRGRTYVRNGSVCHLEIGAGRIDAVVSGSSLYQVRIAIRPLDSVAWQAIAARCAGEIGSVVELLQGKLAGGVMEIVTHRSTGLLPKPGEITLSCSCPDWAVMCKHVAATLYGVGNRLDRQPELLFVLRDVDPADLVAAELALPTALPHEQTLCETDLGDIFGIELDTGIQPEGLHTPEPFVPTGPSIAALRGRLGLSMAAFARELGVSAASVRRWEACPGTVGLQTRCQHALEALAERA